ncbi:MAG TPA: ABC transporter substrate-binding protein/permease [Polyangiaceae bacterium]|nr:ABC transporter substrate-binding protein/permease [Polyangiaceae bacterium]
MIAQVLAGVALLGAPSPPGSTLDEIRRRGELVWGGDIQGGEPYVFEDPSNPEHLVGFEVELADALGRRLGVKARFRQSDWSSLVPGLERGDFDVAMNGLEDTPARRERLLLSSPYFAFGETLAVRTGASLRSLDALRGRRIGTLSQSYAFDLLRGRGLNPVSYEGVSEPYSDLALGRLDAVLLDHVIADRYGCSRDGVECLPGDVARGTYVIGIRRDDATLKSALDDALRRITSDGELKSILERWKLWDARQVALQGVAPPGPSASSSVEPPSGLPPLESAEARRGWTFADTRLFLEGAAVTIGLSASAFVLALPIGLALAIGRLERRRAVRFAATLYVELFRGTPLLLQLYVLYFALAPLVRLGAPAAAILGLSLNYAAYEAEIHRGALQSVPRGQGEAARSLGLGRWQVLRYVLLPQSFRIALPAMTNDFVALLKDSSLVSVITVVELTKRMTIAAVDLRGWLLPGLACAALYLAMSYPLSRLADRLDKRLRHDPHHEPV